MKTFSVVTTVAGAIVYTIIAVAVMSYISLAVPIGPWIEPTLALLGIALVGQKVARSGRLHGVVLATIAGGIGGIIASACAWTFPALYFLDKTLFASWMAVPWQFALFVGAMVFVAGAFGLVIAYSYKKEFLHDEATMPFPIAQMIYKTIEMRQEVKKGYQLLVGAVSSFIFSAMHTCSKLIPAKVQLLSAGSFLWMRVPAVAFKLDVLPMLWAIGFVTGHMVAIPFAVGMFAKIMLVEPIHRYFFAATHGDNFLLAFCSGIMVYGAMMSLISLPKMLWKGFSRWWYGTESAQQEKVRISSEVSLLALVAVCVVIKIFFSWFDFTLPAQIFVVIGAALCAYQLMLFMAKVGLAPLGRFATFVMLPGLMLFGFTAMQATLVSAFVEISGGVAADAISGLKLGSLADIQAKTTYRFQWLALMVCAASIGIFFWLLINKFGLGSAELGAQKAASRALLLNAYDFDITALGIGIAFGYAMKLFRINAALALGGLLMSVDYSLVLIVSGLSTYLVKDKEAHYPFWSGVFAASSLWMLIKALF